MEFQENIRYNRKRRLLHIIIIVVIGIALFCAGCYCGKASCNGVERKTKIETTDGNKRVSQTIKYEDGSMVGGCDCGKDTKAGDIDYNVPDEVI